MSERPGKSRPMPAAPFDDPSIPVLTERLTLPDLDLDFTLPPSEGTPAQAAPSLPATSPAPSPSQPAPPPSPRVLGAEFETDDWLVETIPLAPKPEFSLDLSTIDVPPLSGSPPAAPPPAASPPAPTPASLAFPAPADETHAAAPVADVPPAGPATTAAPTETGFAAADVVIPASLMRVPGAAREAIVAAVNPAPTFDQLPPSTTDTTVAPVSVAPESPAPLASGAFAVPPAPPSGNHWTTLELELRESILRELAQRLPDDVETILRRQLAPAIDAAVGAAVGAATVQLATEIRRAAGASLRDLVDHAVQTELARLRAQRTP